MKILYAASEAAPFAKSGGLADVAGALPKALGRDGIEEEGSHDELLAKQGVYYRLWNGLVSGETL